MAIVASAKMQKYFDRVSSEVQHAYDLANKARKTGFDPALTVEVKLAKNLAERVVGLISVVAPQIIGTKIVDRIVELEKEYGNQDWRVAMVIAHEVAQSQFCTFKDNIEAIEIGIRIGFAYVTNGVVSSPLEGFTHLEIRERKDKGKYFSMHFAGPIRNAGGTAAAVSVVIGDYVRKKMGYQAYDPDEQECERCHVELMDYHERVTNLQYVPSKEEVLFMVKNCPIEVNGDASEDMEVSSCKDLPRVHTNKIRSGFCLIHSSCIPLKAPKLWKSIGKWHTKMDMEQWAFLEEFLKIQHDAKAKKKGEKKASTESHTKVSPVYTYISDLVGGRPVISHPLRSGGMRLRYGRGRVSGYSAQSLHPASMIILDNFVAIATQLKVERPGKAAAMTTCDTIEGPRVLLNNGDVVYVDNVQLAKKICKQVKEILYVGDVLINYGDFFDRAHPLVPSGYCEEWWALELEKKCNEDETTKQKLSEQFPELQEWIAKPLFKKPTAQQAMQISEIAGIPLHPSYIYFFNEITEEQLTQLIVAAKEIKERKIKLSTPLHKILCLIGMPLKVENEEIIVDENALPVLSIIKELPVDAVHQYHATETHAHELKNTDIINKFSLIRIMDKSGIFIGSRMGRPEKAKMRKLSTSPHGLFPVAEQGGRLRSIQSCMENGYVIADCAAYYDEETKSLTPFTINPKTEAMNKKVFVTRGGVLTKEGAPDAQTHCNIKMPINDIIQYSLKKLGMHVLPDLVKGVQGTVSVDHNIEHPIKAILRAQYGLFVNKDGTIRYDASEVPITHFKPREIEAPVEKLVELGYTHDIEGKPLERDDQICEIVPQDVILPCCTESGNEACDDVLYKATKFIDDLLVKVYGVEPYYKLKSKKELIGHYVIGLAPHTSAGTVGRIVGFTKSQGMFCHPLFHASNRRDCDGDELCYLLLMDAFLNFSTTFLPSSRGGTMDAPLVLTSLLDPTEVDDMAFNLDVAWKYPLELYQAAQLCKNPWDVKVPLLKDCLKTEKQLEGMGFTHDTSDLNAGVLCSAYKILPSMEDKVQGQMALADKIRAVDEHDVARIVVQTHFIRDTKGNLRKYSQQEFRCVKCNAKYRRPPLVGSCIEKDCNGKIVFTISQGSIVKYLEPSLSLATRYNLPPFLHQSLELTKLHIEGLFGKEKEKQTGLGGWF